MTDFEQPQTDIDRDRADRIEELAAALIEARTERRPLDEGAAWVPVDVGAAQRVDDRVAELSGWDVAGWKIGCTSAHAQQVLGSAGPIVGRVYSVVESGITLGPTDLMTEPNLEGEFTVVLGRDITPGDVVDRAGVIDAVAEVRPAIEVVGGRFSRFVGLPLNQVIADASGNSHLVLGPPAVGVTPDQLVDMPGVMTVDGAEAGRGTGADVLGDPITALLWLVDHLAGRGIDLRAGQAITTGTLTQLAPLPPGSTAVASFGAVGEVSVSRAG
ncbi:MAG: fumarylacetoacetate hydrolase family protein [Actinomycetota bacterium]